MRLLRTIYYFLTVCACWRPPMLSPMKSFAYTVYYCYVVFSVFGMSFCQIMDLTMNVKTEQEFYDNFYLTLIWFVSCHKIWSISISHKDIVFITGILENKPFQPETTEETEIRNKYDKQARLNAIYYATFIEVSGIVLSLADVSKIRNRKLPYRIWLPYNYTSLTAYILIYAQQIVSLSISAMAHIACDSFIWALLMHTSSQIEIFECRLKKIKRNENKCTKMCVRYHELIYRFATMINKKFKMVIFVQFAVSTLLICVNLYILLESEIAPERVLQILSFSGCILIQIFVYCWYGNEIKGKSLHVSNMIFELDWPRLDRTTKRDLLMIMMRSTYPIEITSAHVIKMNLETFLTVSMKTVDFLRSKDYYIECIEYFEYFEVARQCQLDPETEED